MSEVYPCCECCTEDYGTHPPEGHPERCLCQGGPVPKLTLSEITLSAIQAEATRAHLKHGEHSMLGKRYSSGERLAILMEEVGEVAHELTYDQSGERDKLVKELIQVAAMAASWVEFLEGGHQ